MPVENEVTTDYCFANNRRLSKSFESLAKQLFQKPQLHDLEFNKKDEDIVSFMQSYEYQVSPWPLVIDEAFISELDDLFTQLPKIMHKVLRYFFTNDMSWACEYLNIQRFQAELFLQSQPKLANICARYDIVMSGGTIQLIEINSGGSLGGWQLGLLESQCFKALQNLDTHTWRYEHQNVICNLFNAYCQSILDIVGPSSSGNILLYLSADFVKSETLPSLRRSFQTIYKKIRPSEFANGDLFYFENPDEVNVNEKGEVYFNGIKMDAVILSVKKENELPKTFVCHLEAAALNEEFYYPDAVNLTILGNKLLFAFLHEAKVRAQLDEVEAELVKKYIPWSTKLNQLEKDWSGGKVKPDQWLNQKKSELVIKKAHSQQGKDVVIGTDCTLKEWKCLRSDITDPDDWLVQKYMAPDPVVLLDPDCGLNNFDTVWGVFALSGHYSGGFIRGTISHTGDKVINSARGASEFLLLEEKTAKTKLVI